MKNLTIRDILNLTKGKLLQGDEKSICGKFAYDTREVEPGDVYIRVHSNRLKEEEQYWDKAFEAGANIAIINQNTEVDIEKLQKWEGKALIQVEDTLQALHKIATAKRDLYGEDFPLIGITGSVGKTSTKDMVASVISQKYKTLKTKGNYNNHIGVPLTILGLKDEEVAVVEMGMNHFDEIRVLTNIAKPKIAIITNIGTSHIGNLGSRENILKAKLEILEGMKQKEIIINNDNDLLHKWSQENQDESIKIHTFGIENPSDVWAENVELHENSSDFKCHIQGKEVMVHVPVGGIHFVYNALCAMLAGSLLNIEIEDMKKGIEGFELTKKRMEVIELPNGAKIINDAYNASLESMQASLRYLEGYKNNRKIAVLGDMFELGEYAEELHRKVGKEVAKRDIDVLLCSGENSKFIVEEAKKADGELKEIQYFETKEEILEYLKNHIKENDVILVKASNGMKFYEICDYFAEK